MSIADAGAGFAKRKTSWIGLVLLNTWIGTGLWMAGCAGTGGPGVSKTESVESAPTGTNPSPAPGEPAQETPRPPAPAEVTPAPTAIPSPATSSSGFPAATPRVSPAAPAPALAGLPAQLPRIHVPLLDASLDQIPLDPDAAYWKDVPEIEPFILADASGPARLRTRAKLARTDRALLLLYSCEDPHIWTSYTEHNQSIFKEEVVEAFLDPDSNLTDYFEFEVSPANVRFAGEVRWQDGRMNLQKMDPGLIDSRVELDGTLNDPSDTDRSWTALLIVPFESLGLDAPRPGDTWRGNLFRIDRGTEADPDEFSCWSPTHTNPAAFHRPKYFGTLEF